MFKGIGQKDIFFVSVQIILFGLYVFQFNMGEINFPNTLQYIGLLSAILGTIITVLSMLNLGESLSPFPTPKVGATLHTKGLYSLVRHPIYTGILLGGYGWAFFSVSVWKIVVTILLHVLFYFKSVYEEKNLENKFVNYKEYRSHTGRFFPRW